MADRLDVLTPNKVGEILAAIANIRNGIRALSATIRPSQRLLTDTQLSKELNLSKRTLANYRAKGEFGYYNLPGKILYAESEIEDYLRQHYIPPLT